MTRRMGGWADGRMVLLIIGVALCSTRDARAQALPTNTVRPSAHPLIRYGKWLALSGATLLGTEAYARHRDANDAYNTLKDRCFTTAHACDLGPGGIYLDPVSESLYDRSRTLDHQGARLLIGAETLFAASAVGFVWELIHRRDDPATIPFAPRVEMTPQTTRVSLTVRF